MDRESKEVLNLIQAEFPIDNRPFLKIGDKLNITEEKVIHIIKELKDKGYIRRIGGSFDSKKLGYCSTLCAIKIPDERILEVSKFINNYKGVTHNYRRNNDYNMWFTVIAPSEEEIKSFLEDIKIYTGIEEILELPALEVFKINAVFHMEE